MKEKMKELLNEAKSGELRGGSSSVPNLRPEVLTGILASRRPEAVLPGGMSLLKMSAAGATVALSLAVWLSVVEEKNRQEEAAMVWSEAWETEEQK